MESEYLVKTTATVFDIIESIRDLDAPTVTTIAEDVGIAKSTTHDHLSTLEGMRYVVKDGDGYRLSLQFLEYGMHAVGEYNIDDVAEPELDDLAEETGEVVWLVVEEHGIGIYLSNSEGPRAVQTHGQVGKSTYLHGISAGKAILADLPERRVREIVDRHELPALTENTITTEAALFEELEAVRERGVAFNTGETIEGLRGVGCSITHDEEVIGAIGVGGPAERMTDEAFMESIPDALLGAVNAIELTLRHVR